MDDYFLCFISMLLLFAFLIFNRKAVMTYQRDYLPKDHPQRWSS